MGRARVRDFRTSWWCIRNRTSERSERVTFLRDNECENLVQAPWPWSNLFISYMLSEHFFLLFRKTCLYLEKMTREFKKQGASQTKFPQKYIIRCALQILWVKILTKNWSKMKYNDLMTQVNYIIKWPPKHRIVPSIKKTSTKNCHWNGIAGGLSTPDESRTRLMRL